MEIQVFPSGYLEKVSRIAEGTYGIIYGARSTYGDEYAVKRIKVDMNTNFVGCVKELDFLSRLKGHPFVLNLIGVSKGNPFNLNVGDSPLRGENSLFLDDKVYLITERAAYDINSLTNISMAYYKMIMIESLLGLEYIHGHGIIHRDIKPCNLLWFRNGTERSVKFCDFGISKINTKQETNSCSVVTPIYRAPELYLGCDNYDYKSDVWSLALVFYELLLEKKFIDPNIYTGNDCDTKMIKSILSKIPGIPPADFIKKTQGKINYNIPKNVWGSSQYTWETLLELSPHKLKEFNTGLTPVISSNHDNFIDLMRGMMKLDPDTRFSASQALNHKFFDDFRSDIDNFRRVYPPHEESYYNPNIKIIKSNERLFISELIYYYYSNQMTYEGNKRKYE